MPLSDPRMMAYERLAAPREDGGWLIEPAPGEVCRDLRTYSSAAASDTDRSTLLGRPLAAVRSELQHALSLRPPVVLTGHQAEFIHAGVFVKSAAVAAFARAARGASVHLTVDADLPKSAVLAVPTLRDGHCELLHVPLPGFDVSAPMEAQPSPDRDAWRGLLDQLARATAGFAAPGCLLPVFRAAFLESIDDEPDVVAGLVRGRRAMEGAAGIALMRELRSRDLCETAAFRAFVAHIALRAREFADAYNAAQLAYRRLRRIRNRQRPAPPLHVEGQRVELPFWVSRGRGPRRRLWAHVERGPIVLLADGHAGAGDHPDPVLSMSSDAWSQYETHQSPWPCEQAGWRVRPRALTLTAFARLLFCDLFVHGIGGAKYDEMMEGFVERFFGVRPAPAVCVTATLRLPLPASGATGAARAAAVRRLRDLRYNPQRYRTWVRPGSDDSRGREVAPDGAVDELLRTRDRWIAESRRLAAQDRGNRSARRAAHDALHAVNARLFGFVGAAGAEIEATLRHLESGLRQDRIAHDREYFVGFHDVDRLADLCRSVERAIDA